MLLEKAARIDEVGESAADQRCECQRHSCDALPYLFGLAADANGVDDTTGKKQHAQSVDDRSGDLLLFGEHHQNEDQRNIFGEVGVDALAAEKRGVTAVTKCDAGAAARANHPHTEGNIHKCKNGCINRRNRHR